MLRVDGAAVTRSAAAAILGEDRGKGEPNGPDPAGYASQRPEFDLDLRLQAVHERSGAELAMRPTQGCPDDTSDARTCGPTCESFGCGP
jgi:hypothetical protein